MNCEFIDGGVCAPSGFKAGGIHCGIRANRAKKDIALIVSDTPCSAAAVYTQNKVCGAPVTVTRENLLNGRAQAVICNSGNANTCNADGVEKARRMCELVSCATGIGAGDVIVASTGVIGQTLDIAPIENSMAELVASTSEAGNSDAAQAIMTTDLKVKEAAVSFTVGGASVRIGAMSKGSGMIHPNMATMLCFITTDAAISSQMLILALKKVTADTFNMISIDGDTSTNDMVSIMANGCAHNPVICSEGADLAVFTDALFELCRTMAKKMAADGEGATKLIECSVAGAPDTATAKAVAKSVIGSNLTKAAMFGADANWGRILCAIGYTPGDFTTDCIDVILSSRKGILPVCENGAGVLPSSALMTRAGLSPEEITADSSSGINEAYAKKVLSEDEILISVDMKQGGAKAQAWGCDLTYDYVKINGDYRT